MPRPRSKAGLLAAATAVLTGLALSMTASRVNAQAAPPPPTLTLPDPTTKPLVPNLVTPANGAAAFKYVSSEKQSPVNPYPTGLGDAQNRARGASDLYWGILDEDVSWLSTPLARARNQDLASIGAASVGGLNEDVTSLITIDGWQYPRLTSQRGVFYPQLYTNDPNFNVNNEFLQEVTASAIADGVPPPSGIFIQATQPSTNIRSVLGGPTGTPTYYVAPGVPRAAVDAVSYDANSKFVWRLDNAVGTTSSLDPLQKTALIPGTTIGQQVRYRIIIHIPSLGNGTSATVENRVDDARYVVYYYVNQGGTFVPMQNICIAAQTTGGDIELKSLNGNTEFFPMFSSVNFSTAGTPVAGLNLSAPQPAVGTPVSGGTPIIQGITLDNSTGDNIAGAAILADTITLEPSFDTVSATPTLTPSHGGRMVVNSNPAVPTSPILVQPHSYLPDLNDTTGQYSATTATLPTHYDAINNNYNSTNAEQSFVNNIDDAAYSGTGYANYQPWNVSTVFQGPSSLIDPRYAGQDAGTPSINYLAPGFQVGLVDTALSNRPLTGVPEDSANLALNQFIPEAAQTTSATNNWIYGGTQTNPIATPAPYFSHMQVLIARTEYAQDPNDPTGTQSIQVGAIYALDWQTGAPLWRFPDRTYLPAGATFNGLPINSAGLRNPQIATDTSVVGVFQPIFQVPGIVAVDRNADGIIEDDEVYIGTSQTGKIGNQTYVTTTGNNVSGGIFAAVTMAPRVLVQGTVQIPVQPAYTGIYNEVNTNQNNGRDPFYNVDDPTTTSPSSPGRYYGLPAGGGPTGDYGAVPVGMAFIAAANGVLYAVDAYGNNDTRYFPGQTIVSVGSPNPNVAANPNPTIAPNGLYFGNYLPGTTNVFWSFSATVQGQKTGETTTAYHQRVQGEVPATNSFGSSAPVLAWNYTDSEIADYYAKAGVGYSTPPELRLFVGNTNGVLYALDPTALSGLNPPNPQTGAPGGTGTLPLLKGVQPTAATGIAYAAANETAEHQGDLRWWFQTQGSINMAPAVSLIRHNMSAFNTNATVTAPIVEKGVYVGTQEGHMYALDWDGPVTRVLATRNFLATTLETTAYTQQGFTAYDGTTTLAAALNDDYYFHNILPATTNGLVDQTYGNVRPRWTYPNLYFDIGATGTEKKPSDVADPAQPLGPNGTEIGGLLLAPTASLGPIANAPMLMDFWWQDPDNETSQTPTTPSLVSYVAFVANDPTVLGTPATQSRVYLLDAVGDRANLLTNPRATPIEAARNNRRVVSQPRDKYSPHVLLASASDPTVPSGLTWTYRFQNDAYEAPAAATPPAAVAQNLFDVQLRNSPYYDAISDAIGNPNYETPDVNINTFDPAAYKTPATVPPIFPFPTGVGTATTTSFSGYIHQPGRRMLPTLFVGGVGEAYALDIDPETALFMRWRPSANRGGPNAAAWQDQFTPLPNRINQGLDPYPGDPTATTTDANGNVTVLFGSMAPEDALDPPDHVFDVANNGNGSTIFGYSRSVLATNGLTDGGIALGQQILVRYHATEAQDESLITSLTISGGPAQNRNNVISESAVPQAVPSVPAYPTNDVPDLRPFAVATVTPPALGNFYSASVGAAPGVASFNQSAAATTNTLDFNGFASTTTANALVPGGHLTNAVNQDINDPVSNTRGRITSLPTSRPGMPSGSTAPYTTPIPPVYNAAFQYPMIFATTTGSFLHGFSSNIEGEDRKGAQVTAQSTSAILIGDSAEVGDSRTTSWAFLPGNKLRENQDHTEIFAQLGPGGPSGIADTSNVYFPALDPYALAYRNTTITVPPTGTPYSLNETPNFIADEPNVTANQTPLTGTPSGPSALGAGTVTDPDDPTHPRPDFKPRPLTAAQAAVAGMYPATVNDTSTGDTGFPLDLNGLFFDRQFAGAGGATQFPPLVTIGAFTDGYDATFNYNNPNQYANGDYHVWLRTPGYSNVGARLSSANNTQNGALGLPQYADSNNQIAEGVRHNDLLNDLNNAGLAPQTPFPILATAVTGAGDTVSDDINPAAQNVTWIYTGSSGGVVYAFTPSIIGHESGGVGGEPFPFSNQNSNDGANGGNPQVGIFPASFVNNIINGQTLFGNVRGTAPQNTVSALGGKNYYEWGETVYIVVYDLLARPFAAPTGPTNRLTNGSSQYQSYVPGLANPNPQGGVDNSIAIVVTDKTGGTQLTQTLSLQGAGPNGTGDLIQYYLNPTTGQYVAGTPASAAQGTPLGIAIYKYQLTGSPTATQAQTPGSLLQVSFQHQNQSAGGQQYSPGTAPPGSGANVGLENQEGIGSYFSIANPLAVQGFLASTQPNGTGQIIPLSPLAASGGGDYNLVNPNSGIGPFSSSSNQGLPGEPTGGTSVKKDDSTRLDPNKVGAEYWQALTNGNTIQRIDLNPYTLPLPAAGSGTPPTINPHFGQPIITPSGITEDALYIPVMTSPGYVNHGTTGSTAVGTDSTTGLTQQYLRLLNRSLLSSLSKVRALPVDTPGDLLFRAWPGVLMNDDADPVGLTAGSTNARNYPSATVNGIMNPFGMINPLPWETLPNEAKPWSSSAPVNSSPDYPDIRTRSNSGTALQIVTASGDITSGPGTLTSVVSPPIPTGLTATSTPVNSTNQIVTQIGESTPPIGTANGVGSGIQGIYGTAVNVRIPLYQPANLVAVPTATSTYLSANRSDFPGGATTTGSPVIVGTAGPVQIPRGLAARVLYQANTANPQAGLAPFGYTSKVVVFIDNDGTNRLVAQNSTAANGGGGVNPANLALGNLTTGGKAYRIFEVWAGVPVDESLKISQATIDLGAAAHGSGMQNGLLGYNFSGADNSLLPGFLPTNINSTGVLPNSYGASFKPFTILGTGNVNLYNLRASQKVEANINDTALSGDGAGSGAPFSYFQLGSGTVDSRFGIMAAGADPLLPGYTAGGTTITNPNVMPQIVTSLDRTFDVDWNSYIQTNNGAAIANQYQLWFAGRHPLPKALANAATPSVFGIPASPSSGSLTLTSNTGVTSAVTLSNIASPYIGIAVPLGTPVGEYTSATSNSPFTIFEDHDTVQRYLAGQLYIPTPAIVSGAGSITPVIGGAGPMYGGRNDQYPVTTAGAQVPILPVNGEGVWRTEAITTVNVNGMPQYRFSYLPYTYPFMSVQLKVTESPLTGQFPDFAAPGGTGTNPVVNTGVLPSVDLYPLETADMVGANNTPISRPSSALTPASWRDANGNMHVYISRNATPTTGNGTGANIPPYGAKPGAPYKLYSTDLKWNSTVGSWQAASTGSPIAVTTPLDPTKNAGQWFTQPIQINTANPAATNGNDSDTSPFVLTHTLTTNNAVDGATLFYLNSNPTIAGAPSNQIYYADVTQDAVGAAPTNPQLYFTGGDPSLLRYTPRVAYSQDLGEDFLFYYGGQHGRWSIYYVPRTADNKGLPTGTAPDASVTANVETPIIVPDSIVSASEPAPVYHQIYDQRLTSTTVGSLIDVMDVYYTGISRSTQTPDIYMNRYRITSQTVNGVAKLGLAPLALPRVQGEQLSAINHQSLWRAQNIAWLADLTQKNTANPTILADNILPTVYVKTSGVTKLQTVDGNWQYDPASGVLYQVTGATPKTLTYIYVDAAAGTVRFRGAGAPGLTDVVTVDYTPQAYRLTSDGASNFGPYTFTETRTLAATVNSATNTAVGTAASPLLIRRQQAVPSGRNWLFWQKGATASTAPTLFSAERRVGIDLASVMPSNQSVQLTVPAAANNYTQAPVSITVSVVENPATGTPVPVQDYEFEYGPSGTGRIYIDPQFEGLPITVAVQTVTAGTQGAAGFGANGQTQTVTATGFARYIDELNYSANNVIGSAVEIGTGINEGQASAFLDLFDATGMTRANDDPKPLTDPALIPGKVWLFWSSPRGKANTGYPNGYNTYWETIAPVFESPLVPTPASR